MIFCINISFICIGEDFGKVVWKDQGGRLRICYKSFGRSVGEGTELLALFPIASVRTQDLLIKFSSLYKLQFLFSILPTNLQTVTVK
jgi:hypothetical protein